jgi:hypothetical protein
LAATLLAAPVFVASIAKIPLLDEIEAIKVGLFVAGLLAAAGMLLMVRASDRVWILLFIVCLAVGVRLAYGTIGAARVGQAIWPTLQEARFGVLLIALAPAYLLLRTASARTLKCFVTAYLLMIVVADLLAFTLPLARDLLLLGRRTDNRFVISIVAPWVASAILLLRPSAGDRHLGYCVLAALLMLLHAFLISTSRSEMLLAAGLLGFSLWAAGPHYRLFVALAGGVAAFMAVAMLSSTDGLALGRDFDSAFALLERSGVFGLGFVRDDLARTSLGLSSTFFLSDYGLLLYVLRYGLMGVAIIFALFLLWLHFTVRATRTIGIVLLSMPILIYIAYIPMLDYGSLNGALLLAFLIVGGTLHRGAFAERD